MYMYVLNFHNFFSSDFKYFLKSISLKTFMFVKNIAYSKAVIKKKYPNVK